MHRMVGLGTENLRKPHDLTMRIGNLQAHAGFARNRCYDPYGHDRQRPRQILYQADDLAAFHRDGGRDRVGRDDRSRVRREHLDRDSEVGELLLDQAGGELERLGRDLLAIALRLVKELQRRQRRVGQFLEKRCLLLLLRPLRLLDLYHWRLDTQRGMMLLPLFLGLNDEIPLFASELAEPAILAALPGPHSNSVQPLQQRAHELGDGTPGYSAE